MWRIHSFCCGVSSAAPAALFTVYVEQERFEADYLWRLQPVNLAEHQQRYHNDALPDRAVDSFLLLRIVSC
jgi:hypothetical protein